MLTKEQILQAQDLPRETVPVPEWGGDVLVRTMTGAERDSWEAETVQEQAVNRINLRARLCARCIVDEQGGRLFTDKDAEALGAKSAAALDRVFTVAARLNALSKADTEELEKNSVAGQNA